MPYCGDFTGKVDGEDKPVRIVGFNIDQEDLFDGMLRIVVLKYEADGTWNTVYARTNIPTTKFSELCDDIEEMYEDGTENFKEGMNCESFIEFLKDY